MRTASNTANSRSPMRPSGLDHGAWSRRVVPGCTTGRACPASIWQVLPTVNQQAGLVKTPNRGGEGSLLNAIDAVSAGDIWAAGQTQQLNGAIQTLTEQFTGTAWAVVASPGPGHNPTDDSLDAVASAGSGQVFAAGARNVPGQCCLRTLVLRTTSG
jgi:hypothetical protein